VLVTLHIDTGREMRGGQWQALYLVRGLTLRGHRARLLAPEDSPLLREAVAAGLDAGPLRISALAGALDGVDLVHAHDARGHTLAAFCATPTVVSRRVAFPVRKGLASRWKYGRAGHYVAVSRFVKQTLVGAGVEAERISVVYDGVPVPPRSELSGERSGVVALESADPAKGKKLLEAAGALAGIEVRFSTQLAEDLLHASAFVYITELEGLGSAALLAMASGAVVLASSVGGLPEVVDNNVTGLLTNNDAGSIAERLQELSRDPALCERLAAAARERIESSFTVDHMVSGMVRVYERMLN